MELRGFLLISRVNLLVTMLNDTIMNKTALNRFRRDRVNTNYVSVKKVAI